MRFHFGLIIAGATAIALVPVQAQRPAVSTIVAADLALAPTIHPPVPERLSEIWFVPSQAIQRTTSRATGAAGSKAVVGSTGAALPAALAAGMRAYADGDYAKALPALAKSASYRGPLAGYAAYDLAMTNLRLGNVDAARRALQTVKAQEPSGFLAEAVALAEAECDEAEKDWSKAVGRYERLLEGRPMAPDAILMRLGRAARSGNDADKALNAFLRVYYEFALTPSAAEAALELSQATLPPIEQGSPRYRQELGRALRLFGARQYGPARTAFDALQPIAKGDDREVVELRFAESNYFLGQYRDARDGVRPYLKDASRRAEALFFFASAERELGDTTEYLETIGRIVRDFPTSTWAADGLNDLGTYYIREDEDDKADAAFRQLLMLQPKGPHAERAAWKVGWAAYRQQRYDDTIAYFERGAADYPRSDYRPAWLYWAGRAREALGDAAAARDRYTLVATDYLNSYYGRLALERPGVKPPAGGSIERGVIYTDGEVPGYVPPPPTVPVIRALAGAGLYDEALNELKYAQRMWADSPAIQATIAWILHQQGLDESGNDRFALLRGAINTMRRAYPQFLAAGGEKLPREILMEIFPMAYWDQIRKQSAAHKLDPYVMVALMAQESTFVPDVRSRANAVGLMQLMPATARRQARKIGIRYSSRLLTNPDSNIRLGMAQFADVVKEFGAVHLALASYNAGESPVRRWIAERPDLPPEEFIDDIPYPETQNYVKRILGTAEDYRRLYRSGN